MKNKLHLITLQSPLTLLTIGLLSLVTSSGLSAKIVGEKVAYRASSESDTTYRGYLTYDDSIEGKRPGILVVHEWWGYNAYARMRAEMLAKEGYTALALDMYGEGKKAEHPDKAAEFSAEVMKNLPDARKRFRAAAERLASHPTVEDDQIGAIGYCFGGGVVLNMALMGEPLKGVASFHGSLPTKDPAPDEETTAAVFVAHGGADPLVSNKDVEAFKSLTKRQNTDVQFETYPDATHGFTNPNSEQRAEKFDLPVGYNAKADEASWKAMLDFFKRVFE